jgi:iron-sulfur cluster assembly protein
MDKIISVTQSAIDFLWSSIGEEKCEGVRIDIASGGCCGMTYKLDFVKEISPSDVVIEEGGVKIYIAPRAVIFISGTCVDYVKTPAGGSIVFENPNAKSRCGCGKSFGTDDPNDNACGGCHK